MKPKSHKAATIELLHEAFRTEQQAIREIDPEMRSWLFQNARELRHFAMSEYIYEEKILHQGKIMKWMLVVSVIATGDMVTEKHMPSLESCLGWQEVLTDASEAVYGVSPFESYYVEDLHYDCIKKEDDDK